MILHNAQISPLQTIQGLTDGQMNDFVQTGGWDADVWKAPIVPEKVGNNGTLP